MKLKPLPTTTSEIALVKEEIKTKLECENVESGDKNSVDIENINDKKLKEMEENKDRLFDPCERSPPEDHHKSQEEKRFKYGRINSLLEKKIKKNKSTSEHGMSNVEKDERIKQSTSESDSSVEYLMTASSVSSLSLTLPGGPTESKKNEEEEKDINKISMMKTKSEEVL